jgi:septal ring factor EnvC (AmiA/AmiB activator)
MQADLIQTIATAGGSAALVLAWAKWSAARLIAQYDAAHKRHDERLTAIMERIADQSATVLAKLAALEVRISEVTAMRERFADTDRTVAVLRHTVAELGADVNVAHQKIRAIGAK